MMKTKRTLALLLSVLLAIPALLPATALAKEDTIVLRVCNWEEYIDLGDWDDDEVIDLDSGDIFGENSLVEDFEEWYEETYGKKVKVEYSTFGTNEDLYNMLTIGDVYDIACPSDYMFMKLMAEDRVVPLSEEFFNEEDENNYYIRGLSPYIREIFENHEINGVSWDKCAAGYMWGVTGFVYNPDEVPEEDASTWQLMQNTEYRRQITMKDNVRDSYFAAVGALKSELLKSEEFLEREDYAEALQDEMNDISPETVSTVQKYLQDAKDNLYSFETDSGKADMITGKVVANYQWSGDAVYTMDQAEEDDYYLNFAVPEESTNIYFDGWVMLKCGIGEDAEKQHAAEAFINFISRPDNAIRNMYYIGYTSVISGGEDERIFEYLDWNYGAEEAGSYEGSSFEISTEDEDMADFLPEEDGDPVTLYLRQTGVPDGYTAETDQAELTITAEVSGSEITYHMTFGEEEKSLEAVNVKNEEEPANTEAESEEEGTGDPESETDEADEEPAREDEETDGNEPEYIINHDNVTVIVKDDGGAELDGAEFTLFTEPTVEYDLSYFFLGAGESNEDYVLTVPESQLKRQLGAQYPSAEVIRRASIMIYFDAEQSELINRMWIRVRCFNIQSVPFYVWIILAAAIAGGVVFHFRRKAAKEKLYS